MALSNDDSPVYIRLRGTISAAILRGEYRAGDQLPSVRALAAEHGANPLTVAKAYQSFQDDGYVEVRRGVEVRGFDAEEAGVTVHLQGRGDVRAGWLAGCDGGRSLVRRQAGFEFPGTDPVITGRQAVATVEGAERLGRGWQHTPTGVYVYGPMPGRVRTVHFKSIVRTAVLFHEAHVVEHRADVKQFRIVGEQNRR